MQTVIGVTQRYGKKKVETDSPISSVVKTVTINGLVRSETSGGEGMITQRIGG